MSLRTSIVGVTIVAGALMAIACDKKDDTAKPAPAGSGGGSAAAAPSQAKAPPPATSAAPPPAPAGEHGLAAKDNDAKILGLAKAALACPWENDGFKYDCAGLKAWRDATDDFRDGAGDKTLVNLLEDDDEKVRWLASHKMSWGSIYKKDKDLASRVVGVAEREKTTKFATELGEAVGRINFEKTGVWDRVNALIHKSDLPQMSRWIVRSMLNENKDNDAAFGVAQEMAKNSDKEMAKAGISALQGYSGAKKDDACKFLLGEADATVDELAAAAAQAVATRGYDRACTGQYDALLESLDKRIKAKNTNENSSWSWALNYLCGNEKASADQKKKAEVLAKALAAADVKGLTLRMYALDAALKCDPAGGKTFVEGFTNDKDDSVRRHAKDLLNPKK